MWMRERRDELMEQGLLENDDELSATEVEGQWPGHAAIVALANLLRVNIAVIQGQYTLVPFTARCCFKPSGMVVGNYFPEG